jgi:transposase-like protein
MRTEVARDIRESFTARSEEDAQRLLDLGTEKYEKKASTLVAWMINNIHDGFGVFKLSRSHRRGCRPTNGVENLNKQLKRRRRVASLFPNAASRLRLISGINDGNQRRLGVWKRNLHMNDQCSASKRLQTKNCIAVFFRYKDRNEFCVYVCRVSQLVELRTRPLHGETTQNVRGT